MKGILVNYLMVGGSDNGEVNLSFVQTVWRSSGSSAYLKGVVVERVDGEE